MQSVINRSLITLKKIGALTTTSQIDTLNGDIDEFVPTYTNLFRRYFLDNRINGIALLKQKYLDLKELLELILETSKHVEQLLAIRIAIEESTLGLTALKNNPRYQNDAIMRASLDFLLDNQIPTLIEMINNKFHMDDLASKYSLPAGDASSRATKVKEVRNRMMRSAKARIDTLASAEALASAQIVDEDEGTNSVT
jgi:hypothetical protein